MFVARQIDQLKLMQQADLQLDHHDLALERLEDGLLRVNPLGRLASIKLAGEGN
jgi:hypothetical protein